MRAVYPFPIAESRRLAGRLLRLDRGFGLQRAAMHDQRAGLGKPLQPVGQSGG
jgi:hypothetical protein